MNAYHPAARFVSIHGEDGVNVYRARQLRERIVDGAMSLKDSEERAAYMVAILGDALEVSFREYVRTAADDEIFQIASEFDLEASL